MSAARAISLDRMVNAVEKVRERLLRVARVLEQTKVPYAIAGGNAVAAWVSTVDEAAVRNTRDVDVLIRREDFALAKAALEKSGLTYRKAAGIDMFLDSPDGSAREAVHIVFAGEKVREHEPEPNPAVTESEQSEHFRVLSLEALTRIKLTAFRDKDRTHLRDLLEVGLIDETWCQKFSEPLAERLKSLIDNPEG
jgi:hypothetical protein